MTKAERLAYMKKNFPKYRRDEAIDICGVIPTTSGDISDTMDKMNTFQEAKRDRKNIRGVINSDD
jgi:hypothetical protein